MNLVNRLQFAKPKPSKLVVTINNPLADLFIRQTFSAKHLKRVNLPNILPAKLSCYTVVRGRQGQRQTDRQREIEKQRQTEREETYLQFNVYV